MIFHVFPTALEITMVCGILVRVFSTYSHIEESPWCNRTPIAVVDMEVWLQFCADHPRDNGGLHLVYCSDDGLEVSILITLAHEDPADLDGLGPDSGARPIKPTTRRPVWPLTP